MKALFLDIDGVLTSARAHAVMGGKFNGLVWHHFDPVAIAMLNKLHEEHPELVVVLSSTWRKIYDQQTMSIFLSSAGWRGNWHQNWKTPDIGEGYGGRGREVDAWCWEHKPTAYVILDDVDNAFLEHQRPHFVQTSEQDGMNSLEHFVRAKEALKRKVKWD